MALNSLLNELERSGQTAHSRQSLSEKYYQEGIVGLARAQQENYTRPQSLVTACESLIKAIQYGRTNPKPYIAMGYLMILINDRDKAMRYLLEARRLEPDNADTQAYLDFLSRPAQTPKADVRPTFVAKALDEIEAGFDYDALYEETEARIFDEVKRLMNVRIVPPLADRKQHRQLKAQQEEVMTLIEGFNAKLKTLDEEFDIGELQNRLRPLDQLSRRLTAAREVSRRFILLLEALHQLRAEVDALLQKTDQSFGLTEACQQLVEQILDRTDQLADDLDALEQEGHDIQPVQPTYESLVAQIERLNEIIEDLQEVSK